MVLVKKNTFTDNLNNYSIQDKFILLIYSMYFVLKPFYLWGSGLPQLSDFVMVLLILIFILKDNFIIRINSNNKRFLIIGLLFVSYVVFINLIWVLILGTSDRFVFSAIFYVYNFIVVVLVVVLYAKYKEKLINITYKATLISVFIQIIMYFMGGGFSGGRMTAGFNNPNQLGYYAILVASILIYSSTRIKVKAKWFILGIIASMILAFASLSKAAILAFAGLILFFLLSNNKNKKFRRNLILICIVFSIISIYVSQTTNLIQDNQLVLSVQNRINSIGTDSDDSLDGRGYYRISEYPEYWLFGAGEGLYSRFRNQSMEFHSTLGNIQVSYGIVGMLLFISLIILALRNDKYQSWYIILFIMIYGATHNGIRNSLMWILLALISTKITSEIKKGEHYD